MNELEFKEFEIGDTGVCHRRGDYEHGQCFLRSIRGGDGVYEFAVTIKLTKTWIIFTMIYKSDTIFDGNMFFKTCKCIANRKDI